MSIEKSFRILTLNVEKDKHLDIQFRHLKQGNYDAVLLQEVPEYAIDQFRVAAGAARSEWVPMQDIRGKSHNFNRLGIAILTREDHMGPPSVRYYASFKESYVTFEEVQDPLKSTHAALLTVELYEGITLATTHFCWTKDGEATSGQSLAVDRLLCELDAIDGPLVLTGDFNAPRARGTWEKISAELTDCVPVEITTTIDKDLHYSGKDLQLVVDGIFARNAVVTDVQVHAGLSDHYGLSGTVTW